MLAWSLAQVIYVSGVLLVDRWVCLYGMLESTALEISETSTPTCQNYSRKSRARVQSMKDLVLKIGQIFQGRQGTYLHAYQTAAEIRLARQLGLQDLDLPDLSLKIMCSASSKRFASSE